MATLILLNQVKLAHAGQAMVMRAGDSTADTTLQTAIAESGGLMAPATDTTVADAATYIATMRAKGMNEDECDKVMMLAYMASGYTEAYSDPGSCVGTAPITVSTVGGNAATVGITAASVVAPGSMSAADKTKLDGISALAAVQSVAGTAPISVATGTTTAVVSIVAATEVVPGSMSAADKIKIDGTTSATGVATTSASGAMPAANFAALAPPVANAVALQAIPAASRANGMLCEKLDDGTLWRFNSTSTATDSTSSLVITPTTGTGAWLLAEQQAVLTLPFTSATADNATLFTTPAGAIMVARDAWWEISASMTGGVSSAVGVHCSNTNTTKGDVLGGASGDIAATLVSGTAPFAAVGTQGTKMDTLAHQRVHMVAGDTLKYDRITSAFTAGAGNVRVLCDVIQNLGA